MPSDRRHRTRSLQPLTPLLVRLLADAHNAVISFRIAFPISVSGSITNSVIGDVEQGYSSISIRIVTTR